MYTLTRARREHPLTRREQENSMSTRTTMRVVAHFDGGTEIELARVDAANDKEVQAFARCMRTAPEAIALIEEFIEWDTYCAHLFGDLASDTGWRSLIRQAHNVARAIQQGNKKPVSAGE
jgi:hypothetical protein